ncbi:MAG TPA: hypothetical protein VEX18_11465, partial [Polyangiaceae bacterium]|nr:hypothetical protein [Polyangiaceae bacterium]
VELLMDSAIELQLVGDVRQAILQTNIRDPKYQHYKGTDIKRWFDIHYANGDLLLEQRSTTWRCNALIAAFADTIFAADWGFAPTLSLNDQVTGHDGLFAVATEHAQAYVTMFSPLCLRYNAAAGGALNLPFTNIRLAKGCEAERVLLVPTQAMKRFVSEGKMLKTSTASSLYVAVTRARASVAFVVDEPRQLGLRIWTPY